MKTKKIERGFRCILLLVVLLVSLNESLQAEGQGWFNNSLNVTINDDFYLIFKSQIRAHDVSFQDPFVYILESGVGYKLPKNFYLATFYRRQTSNAADRKINENRYALDAGWKTKLNKTISFDWRFRTEIRRFELNSDVNHFRFRLYLRLTANFKLGELRLKPFIAEEPFWDTKIHDFSQNRFYLGTAIPLSEKVEFVLSYLRQDLKNKEPNQILYTGFNLRF
ncbi:MAG: DUF2490 domain-containing protein [Candidatus Aminicenantes bacterium]|jgi:hypothetical protein|nr:DUF2490 domain-containing protein [Candidatus Aminicenantes bacterium]MDH5383676.1 DUF2490 domain-containing protein [Candidatus Aminicenantes bacterium]MDH5742402.1 DUF2490 domain-containing protein [Candidatus Aminicenantes bacterium]